MTKIRNIIAYFMCVFTLLGGVFAVKDINPRAETETVVSGKAFSGYAGDSTVIKSDEPATVNCMTLSENGSHIKGFTLEALVDGEYQFVTKCDTVGKYRFCSFDDVCADTFKLTVTESEGKFKAKNIRLCSTDVKNDDFRVVSYIVASRLSDSYTPDPGRFTVTTDLIVIGNANFNKEGNITITNIPAMTRLMELAREINPAIRIHLNIIGPSGEGEDRDAQTANSTKLHMEAMVTNRTDFIANIIDALDEYGFDGIYFDWEYPTTPTSKLAFSSFLVKLKYALGERELGAALSDWCCSLTPLAISALDNVEVMCYDSFDSFGYHAAFSASFKAVTNFLRLGYSKKQLHLGLAFYARPTDSGPYWFNYNESAESLGKYNNITTVTRDSREFESYFNSCCMVRDKTQYALSTGLGGVMIWHLDCDTAYDNELSLYKAISEVTGS